MFKAVKMSLVSKHILDLPLKSYKLDMGEFPSTEEGLESLLRPPFGKADNWKGPYNYKTPVDPWGSPLLYNFPGKEDHESYEIFSLGPDRFPSDDDLTIEELTIQLEESQTKANSPETMFLLGGIFFGILLLFFGIRLLSGLLRNKE
jgi:type II secretion system protein G